MPHMNLEQFWEHLRREKTMRVKPNGQIRNAKGRCPIAAVATRLEKCPYTSGGVWRAVTDIRITDQTATSIIKAADCADWERENGLGPRVVRSLTPVQRILRRQMLGILNLTEIPEPLRNR